MDKTILYISYDGMTDPLGQSQVLPYLTGLADAGYKITILSCEKRGALAKHQNDVVNLLSPGKIKWEYSIYKKFPPFFCQLSNYFSLKRKALKLQQQNKFSIVHCRSYISALIGQGMKKRFDTKFIFDMRGFWADERVEGGLWNFKNPLFRYVYKYFKRKEREFLSEADHVITLTEAGRDEILSNKNFKIEHTAFPESKLISVIPCCVDIKLFDPGEIKHKELAEKFREKLKIDKNDFVVSYVGGLGTWYLLDEMLLFFKQLLLKKGNAKFLFITHENANHILQKSNEFNIEENRIMVYKARRNEVPALILLSKLSIFFIKQSFSKMASSPTKMAELMAMGIPIICNNKVGDVESIVNQTHCGYAVNSFTLQEYEKAISQLDELLMVPSEKIRQQALDLFSLQEGIEKYRAVYASIVV